MSLGKNLINSMNQLIEDIKNKKPLKTTTYYKCPPCDGTGKIKKKNCLICGGLGYFIKDK